MKLLVTTDAHIYVTKDEKYWCSSIYGYSFWLRFLEVFDNLRIVARVKKVDKVEKEWLRVDGPRIEIYSIPFYQGPKELLKKYFQISKKLKKVFQDCDAVLFRMPSPTGQLVYNKMKNNKIPFLIEVVYDPSDDLKNKGCSLFTKLINLIIHRNLKKICIKANGVSYVTKATIQKNYPSRARLNGETDEYFESSYSTITLNNEAFGEPRKYKNKTKFYISHSNVSMNSLRKGQEILLHAIKIIRKRGYDVNGIFIGDGLLKSKFEETARDLEIYEYIEFTGLLSTFNKVREILERSDLYVFPTQAEGLPRGIIEAMALGLPCISSPVGGIPEILDEEFLIDPNNPEKYAEAIINLINDPFKMNEISKKNIKIASQFKNEELQKKRNKFYFKLQKMIIKERRIKC